MKQKVKNYEVPFSSVVTAGVPCKKALSSLQRFRVRVLLPGPLLRVTPALSHPASCHISVCPVRKERSEILAKILTFYLSSDIFS